jgi:tetratricopeptide (TPR) repeat protein
LWKWRIDFARLDDDPHPMNAGTRFLRPLLLALLASLATSAAETPDPRAVAERVAAVNRAEGLDAAMEALDREHAAWRAAGAEFYPFFAALWNEAQLRTGRDDPRFFAAVFDWLQKESIARGNTGLAIEAAYNTHVAFSNLGRHGAARSALRPFVEEMAGKPFPSDPLAYPDRGAAFDFLPDVRKRDFSRMNSASNAFVFTTRRLAEDDFHAGDWPRGLERLLWADDWLRRMGRLQHEPDESWLQLRQGVAFMFYRLGLYEAADAQYAAVLENEASRTSYGGRSRLVARLNHVKIRALLGDLGPDIPAELDSIEAEGAENRFLPSGFRNDVQMARALWLRKSGRWEEALRILDGIIGGGESGSHLSARIERVRLLVEAGRLDGLETEIRNVLTAYRETGHKFGESSLYSLYADFLEKQGRFAEALAMRREAVRLARAFRLFASLPVELAKLSALLLRLGDAEGAAKAAEEATRLASDRVRIPARIAEKVASLLQPGAQKPREEEPAATDLQPVRAIVAPLAGMPLRGTVTLANPSATEISGVLSIAGAPASLQWDQAAQEGGILLGAGNKQNPRRTLKLAPGTMAVFALQAPADADAGKGLTVSWTTEGKQPQTSEWTLEPAEEGVPSAVIGAGIYRNNPFYSVPIYHHYQDAGKREGRAAIRVSATSRARIEIHDSADRPVAVDADGDGSLSGKGDSIFQDEDFDGAADLPLTAGEAMFRLQVYPHDPLPEEGIGIVIEVKNGGAWVVTSRNRIVP